MTLNTRSRLLLSTLALVGVALLAEDAQSTTIGVTAEISQSCSFTSNVADVALGEYDAVWRRLS